MPQNQMASACLALLILARQDLQKLFQTEGTYCEPHQLSTPAPRARHAQLRLSISLNTCMGSETVSKRNGKQGLAGNTRWVFGEKRDYFLGFGYSLLMVQPPWCSVARWPRQFPLGDAAVCQITQTARELRFFLSAFALSTSLIPLPKYMLILNKIPRADVRGVFRA